MKRISDYIKESYNFRLGGSQRKGFDQTEVKTFKELEKGDVYYVWTDDYDKDVYFERTLVKDPYKEGNTLKLQYDEVCQFENYIFNNDISNTYACGDDRWKDSRWVIATTFKELEEVVKDKFGANIDKEKVLK